MSGSGSADRGFDAGISRDQRIYDSGDAQDSAAVAGPSLRSGGALGEFPVAREGAARSVQESHSKQQGYRRGMRSSD